MKAVYLVRPFFEIDVSTPPGVPCGHGRRQRPAVRFRTRIRRLTGTRERIIRDEDSPTPRTAIQTNDCSALFRLSVRLP